MTITQILRWAFAGLGAALAILEPTLPYLLICTLVIFADCYTAWSLSRRAAKFYAGAKARGLMGNRATPPQGFWQARTDSHAVISA